MKAVNEDGSLKAEEDSDRQRPSPRCTGIMERLATHLARQLARHADAIGLGATRPWLVGFSHGPDSTVLLTLLARQARTKPLPPIVAVHVDHGLRQESASEARTAERFCRSLHIPCRVVRVVCNGETTARRERYAAFSTIAAEMGARAVLLGHHKDDQVETVLMRIIRGTGPLGLAGIPALRALGEARVFRPLLQVPRRAIEVARRALAVPAIEDPTNSDPSQTLRNRVRHELLPRLREQDPDDERVLALARAARRLRAAVDGELAGIDYAREPGVVRLPLSALATLSPWAGETLLARALQDLDRAVPPRRHLARLLALRDARVQARVEARHSWFAVRERDAVTLRSPTPPRGLAEGLADEDAHA